MKRAEAMALGLVDEDDDVTHKIFMSPTYWVAISIHQVGTIAEWSVDDRPLQISQVRVKELESVDSLSPPPVFKVGATAFVDYILKQEIGWSSCLRMVASSNDIVYVWDPYLGVNIGQLESPKFSFS
ncbi:hypothetical protein FQR65_LT13869 [Abscondita terminalis]|nr:hypothetical protein FQR65_LT13869 [Abscondita terminalis]